MEHFIPLSVPNLKGREKEYVMHALESEWVSTAGPYITDFEQNMAKYVGSTGAVACQSGTAGLHLSLIACGIEAGDEVIVPTLTFVAAVNPIKYVNAEPVFMDCDDSLTMDPVKLKKFCEEECCFKDDKLVNKKSGRRVKAIIVVHVFGNMTDMENIMDLAKKYQIKVIEDATEALGTYYIAGKFKNKFAGTIGDIGVFSFNGNKIITTGGGGMIVSNNNDYLSYCRYLSTQAKDDTLYFDHNDIGYNYRMTNIQAALGIAQLEQLEAFISIKETNYLEYLKQGINLIKFNDNIRPNYWFYSYMTAERENLLHYLNSQNIQTRPIWKLIHTLKPYKDVQSYKIEKAIYYYDHVLNLPCSTNLLAHEVTTVVSQIKKFEILNR